MKKIWIVIILALTLCGCKAEETFETVGDSYDLMVIAPKTLFFAVPEDAAAQVMHSENGSLYFCDGYEIAVQTLQGGDLDQTLRTLTGYDREAMTVMEMSAEDYRRYECVWIAAGEGGDHVGRAAIVDDGQYHYCLTVMAPANEAGSLQQTWQALFQTLRLQS